MDISAVNNKHSELLQNRDSLGLEKVGAGNGGCSLSSELQLEQDYRTDEKEGEGILLPGTRSTLSKCVRIAT